MKNLRCIIVGLGNPGHKYKNTRHNLGFMALDHFAKELNLDFKLNSSYEAEICHKTIELNINHAKKEIEEKYQQKLINFKKHAKENQTFPPLNLEEEFNKMYEYPKIDLYLLKPQTFMNLSGSSVKKLVQSLNFKIFPNPRQNLNKNRILVVYDDIDLPFGSFALKYKGGDASHNGLKSIESNLGTEYYHRLKLGINSGSKGDRAVHVLGQFYPKEVDLLGKYLQNTSNVLKYYLHRDIDKAMNFANSLKPL